MKWRRVESGHYEATGSNGKKYRVLGARNDWRAYEVGFMHSDFASLKTAKAWCEMKGREWK